MYIDSHAAPLHIPGGGAVSMSKRWYSEHRRDPWRRDAKASGYRARAAFKLLQIQERFELMRAGDTVIDVGCHPGGWSQVAVEVTGYEGRVIGVDLEPCAPIDGVELVVGDITEKQTQDLIMEMLEGSPIHSIVSDISPSLTGQYERDQAISIDLVCAVMDFSFTILNPGGSFVTKIFQGRGIEGVVEAAKGRFSKVQRYSPEASRNSSSETFLVCINKLPRARGFGPKETVAEFVQRTMVESGILTEDEDEIEAAGKVGFTVHRAARDDE